MKSDLVFLNDLFAQEKLKEEYVNYKKQKTLQTLLFASIVKIHPGSDGVKWQAFEKQLDRNCRNISDRISRGKYFFAPMLEIEIPKTKGHSLDRARLNDDVRVISVSCIRDTLVQRIIYRMLDVEAEKIFMSLGDISFAYRKKYVAPGAAKQLFQHICDGYFFALDADLVKFFDNIPHILLEQTIETIYEKNSSMAPLLRRFIKSDRVVAGLITGKDIFCKKVPRTKRAKGIPQGGVLSGILSNLVLHEFDRWLVEDISRENDIRYVRYADDFVILAKNMSTIQVVHNLVSEKFLEMGLELHKEPKTAIRDLNHESIDFVGFKLDPTGIRIRARNVSRFKNRIIKKINEEFEIEDISEQKEIIRKVIEEKIAPQIIGTKALKVDICWNCMKPIKPRNWMTFFSAVTDINQFKSLDSWLRKQLNAKLYKNFGIRARASDLKNAGLPSLTNEYYWSSKKHPGFCECDAVKTAGYFSSPIALKELMNTSDD